MRHQRNLRRNNKKRPKFVNLEPKSNSKRYCVNCKCMRPFKFNKMIGHSECTYCTGRFAKKEKPKENG